MKTLAYIGLIAVVLALASGLSGCTVSVSGDWYGQSEHNNQTVSPTAKHAVHYKEHVND
jgi:hypothetical protein